MIYVRLGDLTFVEGVPRVSRSQGSRGDILRLHPWNLTWATALSNRLNILSWPEGPAGDTHAP